MSSTEYARALGFEERVVYRPEVRPGYAAWASLFQFGNGDLGLAVNEIRRGGNPDFNPPPLEYVEMLVVPYRISPDAIPGSNRNLISEYVNLRSSDGGRTWSETGRCRVHTRHYWHVGFPDGRLVRMIGTQHYRYDAGNDRFCTVVEESTDGGNTWREISRFLEGVFFYGHKFKKLPDGSIVAAGPVAPSFGPGGRRVSRWSDLPGQCVDLEGCFLISRDGGYAWDGPHYLFPGVRADEFDVVQLRDGSLLFINSTVQSGRPVRQIVRRSSTGYINEPMMEIRRGKPREDEPWAGFTPETVVLTESGLLVGARRMQPYSCSNDMGENWYEIGGMPDSGYQPMLETLPDGRLLCVWHQGHDNRFGEEDMFIGAHSFRVKEHLPRATSLSLERMLSQDGSQYVNAFKARLTSDGRPVEGRRIAFRIAPWFLPDGGENWAPLAEAKDVRAATTNADGVAVLRLPDKDVIPDIHYSYWIDAVFAPDEGDRLQPCRGPKQRAYAMTPRRNCPANYPVYLNHGYLMLTPDAARRFPDLADILGRFDTRNPDAGLGVWSNAAGGEQRAGEVLDFLQANHIVAAGSDGVYRWYRSLHAGDNVVKEVRICSLEEHCT